MNNFILRTLTSLLIVPIFLYSLYLSNFFFFLILFIIFLISLYELLKNIKQLKFILIVFFLIIFFLYSLIKIRGENFESYVVCLWVISIVSLTDIGGYVFGKTFKGKKLTKYSPNKTYSGLFGSIIFSQFAILIPIFLNLDINYMMYLIQLLLSFVAIIGDIFFSYLKRINNIKDYSNIIPGHGGMLDRIDSMIFSISFFYIFNFFYGY